VSNSRSFTAFARRMSAIRGATQEQQEQWLYRALLALGTVEECRTMFRELCTPDELKAIIERWAVAESARAPIGSEEDASADA
jgi:uncharacterized protein YerC